MKILFITEFFPATTDLDVHGGVEARAFHTAQYVAKKHRVTVICSREKQKPITQLIAGVAVKRVGRKGQYRQSGAVITRIMFILSAIWEGMFLDFDVVEGSGFFGYIPAFVLGLLKRKKKIAWVPDIVSAYTGDFGRINHGIISRIEKVVLNRDWDKIIAISNSTRNKLTDLGVAEDNVCLIYCGVNLSKVKNDRKRVQHRPTIVTIARLVTYKNIETIVEAVSIIKQTYPDVHCEIVGTGPLLSRLQLQIKKLRLTKSVTLHGFIPDHQKVVAILRRSTIFCSASEIEGFGIAVIEAFGAGIPAVLSDIPTHREITHKKGAVFFKTNNSKDLANKILTVLKDRKLYQILKKQVHYIAKQYTWNSANKETEKLYASMYAH